MNKLIVYGSKYGTTKKYAEKMSEITKIPVFSYEEIKDLSEYDEIIHFGALYAGGVNGLKKTLKLLKKGTNLVIVTVGLADVENKENTDSIKKAINQQVTNDVLDRTKIFHLRGGIDYSKLSFMHKMMMSMVYKKAKSEPEEKRTEEIESMIETYNKKVSFVDFDSLQSVIDECKY